jgi:beta-glucanase (GH16 family)
MNFKNRLNKNIALKFCVAVIMFFCFNTILAQQLIDNFEGNGTISAWVADDINVNNNFTNPFSTGINTSATVLQYADYGGLYGNLRFDTDIPFDLVNSHTFTFKIFVASSSITGSESNQVALKLQNKLKQQPWTTQTEIIKTIVLDQWQELSFNFETDNFSNFDSSSPDPTERTDFNRVLLQINGENNNSLLTAYIDDFSYDGELPEIPEFNDLVWSDEFETDGAINSSLWFHQTKIPSAGSWYNGEVQHYTDRIENAEVESGILKIRAKKETFTDQGITKEYTSARLNSKYAFQYGKVEIRAKMPAGVGTWPALWMLGKNINEDGAYFQTEGFGTAGWPACGEIDIMEHWGDNQNYVSSATHTPSSSGATINNGGQNIPTTSTGFHVYGLVWNEDKLIFSVDDVIHFVYNPQVKDASTWPFDAEQYLIFNFAVQGQIDPSFTEDALEVDYVRVYQNDTTNTSLSNLSNDLEVQLFPNPTDDKVFIDFNQKIEKALVSVYDITGKKVNQLNVSDVSKVNLELGQAKGAYFIELLINGSKTHFKVIKK